MDSSITLSNNYLNLKFEIIQETQASFVTAVYLVREAKASAKRFFGKT